MLNKKQYLWMGLLSVLLYAWIIVARGLGLESVLFCLCSSALIVIGMVDWLTYEIPFGCNVFIAVLGGVRLLTDLSNWYTYVIGAFCVSGLLIAVYFITQKKGIGLGDVKLMAAAGLLLGWPKILAAFLIGSVAGSVIHLSLMKIKNKDRVLAFGPYLSFGILCVMLYGERIIDWYLAFCGL